MKKILKYESKRKINKQRFQFFLHKGGAVHFFLILATTIYIIANSIKQIIDTINKNELTFIFATISLIAAIFALIAQMIKFCLDWKKFFSPVANVYEYKNKINKKDVLKIFFAKDHKVLSEKALQSGYVIAKRENSSYVYSDEVNKLLFEEKYNLKVVVKNKIVTEEEQIVLASILQKYVESKGNIYNDQLLGQVTDLFIDLPKEIILNKTCYFSNKATNDIVYSKFCSKTKQTYEFNGYKFTLDANNQLYDLRDSNAANIIGVSTIILTNDNHLILSIQNSNSDESAGLIVATGSGSATVKDYQKHQSFYEFLTTGMERELIEETSNSLRYKDLSLWFRLFNQKIIRTYKNQEKQLQSRLKELFKPNSTKVYCYNRILHRGGKPDFFGITKVNVSSTEIKPLIDDCNRHTKELLINELKLLLGKKKDKMDDVLNAYDAMLSKLNNGIIIDGKYSVIKEYIDFKKEATKNYNLKFRPLEYENLGLFMISLDKLKKMTLLNDNQIFSLQVEYMVRCLVKIIEKI